MPSPFSLPNRAVAAPPDALTDRFIFGLRLAGHDFDAIALALAAGAVEALIAGGFRAATLQGGLARLIDAMRDHAADLSHHPLPPPPPDRSSLSLTLRLER